MNMTEVKTADLIGPALDWAVAKVEGISTHKFREKTFALFGSLAIPLGDAENGYAPSTCWHCGGPLIEKYHVQTSYNGNGFSRSPTSEYWCAYVCKPSGQEERPSGGGPTVLAAICRAIIAAKLGDVVSVPSELLEQTK